MGETSASSPERSHDALPEGSGRNVGWLQWLFTMQAAVGGAVTVVRVVERFAKAAAQWTGPIFLVQLLSGMAGCLFIVSAIALWKGWRQGAMLAISALALSLFLHAAYYTLGSGVDPDHLLAGRVWAAVLLDCLWLLYFVESREIRGYYGPFSLSRFREMFRAAAPPRSGSPSN